MKKKKVLITGASRGIGKAIAEKLTCHQEYEVFGTSRNINTIVDTVKDVHYIDLDLGNEESINKCIKVIGNIDILINNAGMAHIGAFEDISPEAFDHLFNVNFFGTLKLIRKSMESMKHYQEGIIINISSLADTINAPFLSGYCASKAAMSAFTRCLRMELKEYNIKVILICPTDINSGMKASLYTRKNSTYQEKVLRVEEIMYKNMSNSLHPNKVARLVESILIDNNPKPVYYIGKMIPLILFFLRFLPDRSIEKLIKSLYKI